VFSLAAPAATNWHRYMRRAKCGLIVDTAAAAAAAAPHSNFARRRVVFVV